MKKSDILSKDSIKSSSSDNHKNLNLIYKDNKKLIDKLIKIKEELKLNNNELINEVKENIQIPLSIFINNSPLESLVKYLKENIGLNLSEISRLLNRDERTIWITYNNSKKITRLDLSSKVKVDVVIFSDRKFSVLENLVYYLVKEENYSLSEISKLISRNYKTIWTLCRRAKEKDA